MENVNATSTKATEENIREQQQQQQQHSQQHEQLQQHHQEQQQQHEHQQQFCLRWHNHQTSLLSTLPVLLDQSHLTDVTISAEGRMLRAHRVVLSACSTFFLELFRTLDTNNHPIIIIPGATFAAIVALLTFMYSGEVNVYEEQIPLLLSLAETLGIKGLADVQNNLQKSNRRAATAPPAPQPPPPPPATLTEAVTQHDFLDALHKDESDTSPTSPTPPPLPLSLPPLQLPPTSTHAMAPPLLPPPLSCAMPTTSQAQLSATSVNPFNTPLLGGSKFPTPLESLFLKSLQFYPNLLPQPLNFSQTALNKTSELLAKYQQQCNSLYQNALGMSAKDILPTPFGGGGDEYASAAAQMSAGALGDDGAAGGVFGRGSASTSASGFGCLPAKRFCSGDKQRQLSTANATHQQPPTFAQRYAQPQQTQQVALNSPQHTPTHAQQQQQQQQKDNKRIDKIVENLRKTPLAAGGGETSLTGMGAQTTLQHRQSPQQQQPLQHLQSQLQAPPILSVKTTSTLGNYTPTMPSPLLSGNKSPWSALTAAATLNSAQTSTQMSQQQQHQQQQQQQQAHSMSYLSAEDQVAKLQQQIDQFASCSRSLATATAAAAAASNAQVVADMATPQSPLLLEKPASSAVAAGNNATAVQPKPPSNSKLYATCFICHKQLSNQYNLRVHLETHQNVRYACNVCSHVSRSKDALRKHVSYRHPGAPSPCETEARRKRAAKAAAAAATVTALAASPPVASATTPTQSSGSGSSGSGSITPTSPAAAIGAPSFQQLTSLGTQLVSSASAGAATVMSVGTTSSSSGINSVVPTAATLDAEAQMAAAAQLSSAYMFLPNQFHLAAAAAAAAQQHQQQQQQQQQQQLQNAIDASNAAATVAALGYSANTTATSESATTTTTPTPNASTTFSNGEECAATSSAAAFNGIQIKREPSPTMGGADGSPETRQQSAGRASRSPMRLT